jgi:hypothetical protein
MKLELPPALFYGVGAILIIFGALRAHTLGWQRRARERGDEQEEDAALGRRPNPTARRHLTFGLLWVLMGIFLVVSTYYNSRR